MEGKKKKRKKKRFTGKESVNNQLAWAGQLLIQSTQSRWESNIMSAELRTKPNKRLLVDLLSHLDS